MGMNRGINWKRRIITGSGWALLVLGASTGAMGLAFADDEGPSGGSSNSSVAQGQLPNANQTSASSPLWANYYGIFYGPSVANPSYYQVNPDGTVDRTRPIFAKNFLTVGYNLSDTWAFAATGWWTTAPIVGQGFIIQDPQARIADNSIFHTDEFNWYGDLRAHFPVTDASRLLDELAGFQTFHYLSYTGVGSRWTFSLALSARYNFYGTQGLGNDLELYAAPGVNFQVTPTFALSCLYEMGANHLYGEIPGVLENNGTDLEPGISWQILSSLNFNPYLTLFPGNKLNWQSTSFGATLSWIMM